MKNLLALILFFIIEALVKQEVFKALQLQPLYHYAVTAILIAFALCLLYLANHFRKDDHGRIFWETLSTPPAPSNYGSWILIAILGVAVLLRFWRLGTLFEGMFWDEAYKGLDAIAIREFGERPVFLDWNAGREALIAYLVAFSQWLFGYTVFSVRAVPAFAGCLSVIFFYSFSKKIFNMRVALIGSFLFAVSKWDIIMTRHGVRASLIVLFELFVLHCVAQGMASPKKNSWWFVAGGIAAGFGFYTYIAYRIFPLILLAFVISNGFSRLRPHLRAIVAGSLLCLAIITPLAKFSIENFNRFTDRMQRTAVWKQQGEDASPAKLILDSTAKTLGMFTYSGETIARLNIPGQPILSRFSSSFFILVLLVVLMNIRKPYAVFLLAYFLLTLLPGFLSIYAPNMARTIGCVPPAILLTTLGILAGLQMLSRPVKILRIVLLTVLLSGNLVSGVNNGLLKYAEVLDNLPPRISSLWGMDRDQHNVARLINNLGNGCEVYLSPQFFYHATTEYLTYKRSQHHLYTIDTN